MEYMKREGDEARNNDGALHQTRKASLNGSVFETMLFETPILNNAVVFQ